ncbi:hypothetical protein Prudu_013014 [Prunus dulcis]|uniref:Uncharacterized protein n=1 Tax=Prunus dulcis TaxID=3755 RepID=A0A4Y1REZ0_PRUDU|nr:hypothetical protein Prudu_013014 [Prunus dulcis]
MTQIVVEKAYVENFGAEQGMWSCSFPPSVTMTQHQQPHLLSSQVSQCPYSHSSISLHPSMNRAHCLLFSQSLSDFESFHRLSSFCDDVDETGSAAVNQSILGRQSGQASHIVLSCAGNFVSSGLKAKTRVDLEKRRAEKERAEKGHVPSGYFLPLTFKVFQLAAYPPFPASDMGWGKELGQMLSVSLCNLFDATDLLYNDVKYERVLFYLNGFNELIPKEVTIRWKRH